MSAEPDSSDAPPQPEARHPLAIPDFRNFWLARVCNVLGTSAQASAVGWQVYDMARQDNDVGVAALYLSLIGLAQFLALLLMTVPAGIVADRYDRKRTICVVVMAQFLLSLAFFGYTYLPNPPFWGLFALSSVLGVLRAFGAPASQAIGPMLVPRESLPQSIAINSIAFQTGLIAGPALGGFLVALPQSFAPIADVAFGGLAVEAMRGAGSPRFAYGFCAALTFIAVLLVTTLKTSTKPAGEPADSKTTMIREGAVYIWSNKVIFGAISLDLFAVLLGGATALMPVFTRDILSAGPEVFGVLRASPAIGAIITSFILSARPIRTKAGPWMFASVAVFGVMTIIFGLSTSVWLSIAAMIGLGAADMVSVYVRNTLVQIVTPDAMRGRVASVSYLFIGASNELGEFESGVAAYLMGPVGAALFGGIGSLVVTVLWIKLYPALYHADSLDAPEPVIGH
jgi:MFS family permease